MYKRNNVEEVPPEETKVWECTSEDCKGWIRDNFTSSDKPSCPLCGSEMKEGTKMLQAINNPRNK
ncbi:cold-shock protein [Actinomycetes bacterium NPDC127524]|uniref:cold-shock protein n=1 Tax=Bacillaceae TaxID=186817 RepID=UPI0008E3E238|nr:MULTISPECIES: cold-shock protein [unclassified Bacillus (in: firmicutes)]OIK09005.1 cold-shock protein [Bacillus sp. MUM 13]SFC78457.1 Cold-inducible protein YdjO [Bacillus sp. OV322]